MQTIHRAATLAMALALSACISIQNSTPIDPGALLQGLTLERSLPTPLPDKSVSVPHRQYVLMPTESAVGLLMPVPFVSDAINAVIDNETAKGYEAQLNAVDPYAIALASLRTSPYLKAAGGAVTLQPFVAIQECADDSYRLALVYHLKSNDWVGRYTYHLPTAYPAAAFRGLSPGTIAAVRQELVAGADVLAGLITRGARGQLPGNGPEVDVGSLQLVCGKAIGLMSPTLAVSKHGHLIEEADDHVLVRLRGDMGQAASVGGMYFGVHYLRRDQLHTFNRR